ncbi:enoyl-CoA hydratase/isomerase family protein [Mycobacterium lepromatosis]|uniref:enoyl-CoA hydratase/isomerase family protein n=1 Tax=Mycobacterium lepromatosis TaxID=480418 RepID=UPI0006791983|nr:hypothetical protein [Mycobacterium lepromatosis]
MRSKPWEWCGYLAFSWGRVNALDVELLDELTEAIRELQCSGGRVFDVVVYIGSMFWARGGLNRVLRSGVGYIDLLLPALSNVFEAMFCCPGPDHDRNQWCAAIAGGCVLACVCSCRLLSPDAQIGRAEVRVGVVVFSGSPLMLCFMLAGTVLLGGRIYRRARSCLGSDLPTTL